MAVNTLSSASSGFTLYGIAVNRTNEIFTVRSARNSSDFGIGIVVSGAAGYDNAVLAQHQL